MQAVQYYVRMDAPVLVLEFEEQDVARDVGTDLATTTRITENVIRIPNSLPGAYVPSPTGGTGDAIHIDIGSGVILQFVPAKNGLYALSTINGTRYQARAAVKIRDMTYRVVGKGNPSAVWLSLREDDSVIRERRVENVKGRRVGGLDDDVPGPGPE